MNPNHNADLRPYAQALRTGMTREEKHLWYDCLRDLPLTFNRQKVMGRYIVDFYCAEARLVIELDGSQHYESEGRAADTERDAWLRERGLTVLRFSNADIHRRFDSVCEVIYKYVERFV